MEDDFIRIDLHIHTPASRDYKGARNEKEYLQILREAKSKGLRIIAITDHNSIDGYKAILKLKDKLDNQRESLSSITDSEQTRKSLSLIESNLSLFDDLLILPGIEFEVNNGIHLLIIFSDKVPLQRIEKLLLDGGYTPGTFGEHQPSIVPNWDIFAFYEESKKYDCMIIDAHTDSAKGILNTIPKGMTRANCFRSPQLCAVCYNNETQKDKLKSTLQFGKEYSRTFPLSFVRFSDSHIASDVGSVSTWVKVDSISFDSLKKALTNPSENVSTEQPSTIKILDELIELPNSFGIADLTEQSKDLCKKCICALLNSDGGYILLGVTQRKNKVGIPLSDTASSTRDKDKYKSIVDDVASCLSAITPLHLPSITFYPLQNNRVIASLRVPTSDTLATIKNENRIYSFFNGSISVMSGPDIQSKIEQKTLKDVEQRVFTRIAAVENDCTFIKNVFSTLPLIRIFDKTTRQANFHISVPRPIGFTRLQFRKLEKALIVGASRGNVFFFQQSQSPRLPYAYLRYSLPLFTLQQLRATSSPKQTIYIVPGGGVYYSKRDYPFASQQYSQILKLHELPANSRYGMKFTVCFLKSTLLLWYLINKFDDTDLFDPKIFRKLRFPRIDIKRSESVQTIRQIEDTFDKILDLERDCLVAVHKCNTVEAKQNLLTDHNTKVDELAYSIDLNLYSLLGFSQDSVKIIEDNIRLNKMYLPQLPGH
jgi:hypothetical protein